VFAAIHIDRRLAAEEAGTALKFAAVGLIGLAVDAALLRLGLGFSLQPAVARAISLFCAMQVTFTINGLHVFRCLTLRRLPGQWAGYMATNGLGNLCNYWLFVTLISLHWPIISNTYLALVVGSLAAYVINFAGARLFVFGKAKVGVLAVQRRLRSRVCGPEGEAEAGDPA
jgi:putative flippase GtrA